MNHSLPCLRAEDFARSYDLHDGVDADIPLQAQPGEPGIHWVARGLLVETCLQPLGWPLSLGHYHYPAVMTVISVHLSLASTVLSTDGAEVVAAVELLLNRDTGRWGLLFTGRLIDARMHLPAPAFLADRIAAAHAARREPGPTARRRPVF
jgi:hypothetical protein